MVVPHTVAALAAVLLIPAVVPRAPAQERPGSGESRSTLDGAYSEAQARKGEETYQKHCTPCHAPAVHTGRAFQGAWTGRTVYDLFELIRTTMPNDNPGRLSRKQYAEILAYLFQLNGLPPGARPLPSDDDGLKLIRIETRPGGT